MTSHQIMTDDDPFTATMNGDYKALLCLKEAGYDLKQAEDHGFTPEYLAALEGHEDCLRLIQGSLI